MPSVRRRSYGPRPYLLAVQQAVAFVALGPRASLTNSRFARGGAQVGGEKLVGLFFRPVAATDRFANVGGTSERRFLRRNVPRVRGARAVTAASRRRWELIEHAKGGAGGSGETVAFPVGALSPCILRHDSPEVVYVRQPRGAKLGRHAVADEGLFQDAPPPIELPTHDPVTAVGRAERSTFISNPSAHKPRGELVLEVRQAVPVHPPKEEPDHGVVDHVIHELADQGPEPGFAAELVE